MNVYTVRKILGICVYLRTCIYSIVYLDIRLSDKEEIHIFYFFNQVIVSINEVVDTGEDLINQPINQLINNSWLLVQIYYLHLIFLPVFVDLISRHQQSTVLR